MTRVPHVSPLLSPTLVAIAAAISASLAACSADTQQRLRQAISAGDAEDPETAETPPLDGSTTKGTQGVAPHSQLPAAWRYIAVIDTTSDTSCPLPTSADWTTTKLFRQGLSLPLLEGTALPQPLDRFCEYAWKLAPQHPPNAPSFSGGAKVIRIDPDRDLILPQAPAVDPAATPHAPPARVLNPPGTVRPMGYLGGQRTVREKLAAGYRSHTGSNLTQGAVPRESTRAPIVAVVDSVGYDDAEADYGRSPPRMQHGLAMAGLIRNVRCPAGERGCEGRLFHAQAFPYTAESPLSTPGGGPLGSLGSLAQAVGESVIRWRAMPATRGPLILNLSLGWDPSLAALDIAPEDHMHLLKGDSTKVPATVQAVHAGLAWAACNNALTIAAAGNNVGDPCEGTGPLAPAAWERLPSPTATACAQLFGKDQIGKATSQDAKVAGSLVYAAAGLTYVDKPLPNARDGSLPRRALPGLQAVAGHARGRTDAWTGSSVAAATLSGIAARSWSIDPQLPAATLLRTIDSSGAPLGITAQLHLANQASGAVRKITAHDALVAICDTLRPGSACANPYAPPLRSSVQIDVGNALRLPSQAAAGVTRLSPSVDLDCSQRQLTCSAQSPSMNTCSAPQLTAAAAGSQAPQAQANQPWNRPQPDMPLCPVCPIHSGELFLSPNPGTTSAAGGGATLSDPTLRFQLADGSWIAAQIDDIQLGTSTIVLDLSGYRVVVDGQATTLAELVNTQTVGAGELEFTVPDAAGMPSPMVSTLSIH